MKLLFLVSLLVSTWFVMNNKTMLEKFSGSGMKAVPVVSMEELERKGLVEKQIISAIPKENMEQLKELGIDPQIMTAEVYSPAIALTKKMDNGAKSALKVKDGFAVMKSRLSEFLLIDFRPYLEQVQNFVVLFLVSVFVLKALKLWMLLRLTCTTLFSFSRYILVLLSIASVAVAYYAKMNIWSISDSMFFWLPAGVFCISALGLRFVDMNFPVWRTLFKGFALPLISAGVVYFIV